MKGGSFAENIPYHYILQDAHSRKRTRRLKCSTDAQTADGMGFKICDVNFFKQNIAAAGLVPATNQIKQRGFAGAVWAHQADNFAFADRKINIGEGTEIVKRFIDRFYL